jgi:S-DNA-T family DNA segregation ATPase FtsK/SpoIIIE
MGRASTSTLQRRLRIGYGRAAHLIDLMEKDGIVGPPDGTRPREVLKGSDWMRDFDDREK